MYLRNVLFFLKKWGWLISGLGLSIYLYRQAFSAYFFQDDWFSFSISRVASIKDILGFFLPRNDVIYYRPLGMQLPFFLSRLFFGFNPLPFRIATLFIHLLNGILVYQVLKTIIKKEKLAIFGALLYLTSSVHMIVFYWAATFSFVLAPLFYFSAFLAYIRRKLKWSFLFFIIGLFANELLLTLPLVLLFWEILCGQPVRIKQTIKYWGTVFIYIIYRFTFHGFSSGTGYAYITSATDLVKNIRDYGLWIFNWPEEIHNQFITLLGLNSFFLRDFGSYILIFSLVTALGLLLFFLLPTLVLARHKKIRRALPLVLFGFSWIFISLLPILFYAHHSFAYYLIIPLAGMLIAGLYLFEQMFSRIKTPRHVPLIFLTGFLGLWIFSSYQNLRFNQYVHWAPRRAYLSRILIYKLLTNYPQIPPGTTVLVERMGNDETKWALNDQSAARVLYDQPTLTTRYVDIDTYLKNQIQDSMGNSQQVVIVKP